MDARTYRWNVACHFLDGVFFFAALMSFSPEVVMPKFIADLTPSDTLLSLRMFIIHACLLAPQAFYAKRVEGLAYKKPTVMLCVGLQRIGWLVFFASLFYRWSPAFTLPVFFGMLAVNSLASGMIIPIWTDWYAKTVPEGVWGRLLGMRRAVPAVLGLALGRGIQWAMETYAAPRRYQLLVAAAIVFYALSAVFVALVKEERHDGLPHQRDTTWRDYFGGLAGIVRRRRDFRTFLLGALTVALPIVVLLTFLTKHGLSYPGVSAGVVGVFTMCSYAASAAGALVGGRVSDRLGAIVPFRIFPPFVAAAAGIAVFSASPAWISVAWALLGFAFGVSMVVTLPAVFRFAGPHRRPSYSAVHFVCLGAASATVPIALGLLLDIHLVSYEQIFAVFGALALVGWALFLRMPAPRPHAPGDEGRPGQGVQG